MNKLYKAVILLFKDRKRLLFLLLIRIAILFPDKLYLSLLFRLKMGYWFDWNNPKSFSEKLQWLKLYNRNPLYSQLVDKYEVKNYVSKQIGQNYIISTLGVWDKPEYIDWDILPTKFVLKTTHGGGGVGVIVCKDKSLLDKQSAILKLKKAMKQDIFTALREWPYKNVKPRIIAEEFVEETENNQNEDLQDYKFYCFGGEPKLMMISTGRSTGNLCFDYYDMDWNKVPLVWDKPNSNITHFCPSCFDEMKNLCRILSKDIPHVRCDFYVVNNKPLFGELTFFDSSGFSKFEDEKWNFKIGEWIDIPSHRILK
ncbi:MAG: glycosyl transferase [Bacteroides sp.]|nr:glycosyl transferase [Bacteroides sp.]